jgi:hypothetical protein
MENGFMNMVNPRVGSRRRGHAAGMVLAALLLIVGAWPAAAQEQILFPATDNAEAQIVAKINNERVRLDIGLWLLNDGEITQAIINKFQSGVPVRVLGDRAGIFESDPNTRASFERLANAGVPIRLRYNPTWFPEILHWKCGIYVGQNQASFGSANWTSFELRPVSATNYKDETVLFTNDTAIVQALLTKFDQFWVDTTYFLDWPDAYQRETGTPWTVPMSISRVRLEPDYPTNIPGMGWGQGPELINPMIDGSRSHRRADSPEERRSAGARLHRADPISQQQVSRVLARRQ